MKKWLVVVMAIVIVGAILLSGCAKGVAPEEFAKVKADLGKAQTDLVTAQNQIKALSAISAYGMWRDQYYNYGTEYQFYQFETVEAFNKKLGTLTEASGDSASLTAWKDYLNADKKLNDLVKSYPSDYNTWTAEQTKNWTDAANARYTALYNVGVALFSTIAK